MAFISLLEVVYPVGSIYLTTQATSQAEKIGGTCEQVEDKFLIATSAIMQLLLLAEKRYIS